MASDLEKYASLLKKLLPRGLAWDQVKDTSDILKALAGEFCRVEERAGDLLNKEMDPSLTEELLTDWETMLGIPDECTPDDLTIGERRVQIVQKLADTNGLSADFYEGLGALLGHEISARNAVPFRVGKGRVGQFLENTDGTRFKFRVGQNLTAYNATGTVGVVGQQLRGYSWIHYFVVTIPIEELVKFRVGLSRVGDPLVDFGNELLECTLRKRKPARAGIVFRFGGTA